MIPGTFEKRINKIYEVKNDGKNCLYVSLEGRGDYYSDFVYFNGPMVKIHSGGLNLVHISNKLKRRFNQFLSKGLTIYATASYVQKSNINVTKK